MELTIREQLVYMDFARDKKRLDVILKHASHLTLEVLINGRTTVLDSREKIDQWMDEGCPVEL
jgi:hypothetical protein